MQEIYQILGTIVIFAVLLGLDAYVVMKLRQVSVSRLYLAAFSEACDLGDSKLVRARCKTPGLRKFHDELTAYDA